MNTNNTPAIISLEQSVRDQFFQWAKETLKRISGEENTQEFFIGKLLRTQLAWHLMPISRRNDINYINTISDLCCAVEISHIASLFHDDVIDNGIIRRGIPTLWKKIGKGASILTGDIFICEVATMILNSEYPELLPVLIKKIQETCETEISHEISSNTSAILTKNDYLKIARGKTGPLFAFAAMASSYNSNDIEQNKKSEEIGYLIGTVYQLVDDYIDVWGTEEGTGKTLGTDLKRQKATFPQSSIDDPNSVVKEIEELVEKALSLIDDKKIYEEVEKFISEKILLGFYKSVSSSKMDTIN